MTKSQTYTRAQIEAAIAKMPLVFHEQIIPKHPAKNPDTGETFTMPEQLEMVADLRMRMPLRIDVPNKDGITRSLDVKRKIMRRHFEDYMRRTLFEFVTGEKDWPAI